jgi:hypothetical protein
MKELTITRHNWSGRSAYPNTNTGLFVDGSYCCLGFYCKYNGQTDEEIKPWTFPQDRNDRLMREEDDILTPFALRAALLNDSENLTQEQKEQKLIAHFATAGITLNFID